MKRTLKRELKKGLEIVKKEAIKTI